jgi:hypothetical protein
MWIIIRNWLHHIIGEGKTRGKGEKEKKTMLQGIVLAVDFP